LRAQRGESCLGQLLDPVVAGEELLVVFLQRALREGEGVAGVGVAETPREVRRFCPLDVLPRPRIDFPEIARRFFHLNSEGRGAFGRHEKLEAHDVGKLDLHLGHQTQGHDLPHDFLLRIIKFGAHLPEESGFALPLPDAQLQCRNERGFDLVRVVAVRVVAAVTAVDGGGCGHTPCYVGCGECRLLRK